MGILGCISCIVGSEIIVIHAPQEHTPNSVQEIWDLATQPAFLVYVVVTISVVLALILHFEPCYGQINMLVYLGICFLMRSLTVVSIKAIGIRIKLMLEGIHQITYPQTCFFITVATICVITQLNYLNKALIEAARDVTFWKRFALEASRSNFYSDLGRMLQKLQNVNFYFLT